MALRGAGKKELYVLLRGGQYQSTGRGRLNQTGHRDFEAWKAASQGFLRWLLDLRVYAL